MLAPSPERGPEEPDLSALKDMAQREKVLRCDAPRNSGWRPGARWAQGDAGGSGDRERGEVAAQIAALPAHQRPPMRMLGRASEPAEPVFRRLPAGDGVAPQRPTPVRHRHGPPIVTTIKVGSRVEVAAASPVARALGIAPGMALTQARASIPDIVVRDADPAGDAAALHALAVLMARRWTPVVAVSDADGLFLDLTGVAHLHGGEERFARRLSRLLARHGFTARIAIADTAGAAWALARHGGAPVMLCPPGAQAAAIAPLPAAGLRIEGAALTLLRRLGVETIGDVFALPAGPFARRFGAAAMRRREQALGLAAEPLDPVVPHDTIRVSARFVEPIASPEAIAHALAMLVPRLTDSLAQAGLGARAVLLTGQRVDGVPQHLRLGLARPSRDAAHILRLLTRRIEEIEPGYGLDALHLTVRRADPLGPRPFDAGLDDARPDLSALIDTIANRGVATWRDVPVESHVPERSIACVPALDTPAPGTVRHRREDVRQLDRRVAAHPWRADWPRPARLLRRPERLDHVIAALPDQPPRCFTWRGVRHEVVCADGPERIAGEWWRRANERDAVRDYFRVEDSAGRRFWLFRRGDGERGVTGDLGWYLHGLFG